MSYDFPRFPQMYGQSAVTHVTTDKAFPFTGPKGYRGRLIDYGFWGVTTTFAGATTTPMACVGSAGDQDLYGEEFDGGLAAATGGTKSVLSTFDINTQKSAIDAIILNDGAIPADAVVYLRSIAATGGGAAGVSNIFAFVFWGA